MWAPVIYVSRLFFTIEDYEDEKQTASQEAALAVTAQWQTVMWQTVMNHMNSMEEELGSIMAATRMFSMEGNNNAVTHHTRKIRAEMGKAFTAMKDEMMTMGDAIKKPRKM